jgi:hypothetical protein
LTLKYIFRQYRMSIQQELQGGATTEIIHGRHINKERVLIMEG